MGYSAHILSTAALWRYYIYKKLSFNITCKLALLTRNINENISFHSLSFGVVMESWQGEGCLGLVCLLIQGVKQGRLTLNS